MRASRVWAFLGTFVCESERCQEATSAETEKCPSLDAEFGERIFHELG